MLGIILKVTAQQPHIEASFSTGVGSNNNIADVDMYDTQQGVLSP